MKREWLAARHHPPVRLVMVVEDTERNRAALAPQRTSSGPHSLPARGRFSGRFGLASRWVGTACSGFVVASHRRLADGLGCLLRTTWAGFDVGPRPSRARLSCSRASEISTIPGAATCWGRVQPIYRRRPRSKVRVVGPQATRRMVYRRNPAGSQFAVRRTPPEANLPLGETPPERLFAARGRHQRRLHGTRGRTRGRGPHGTRGRGRVRT